VTGSDLKPLVECPACHLKFCMAHRIEVDHHCQAKLAAGLIIYFFNSFHEMGRVGVESDLCKINRSK
jgi:hypothetical protein